MLSKFFITGDCHGVFTRFYNLPKEENIGVIILGDFSINFYLNKNDIRKKKELYTNYPHIIFYCVRGNHEARPQDLPNIEKIFDENVHGVVYYEPEYPNIRYFLDYDIYNINEYSILVIGGAYSVDKEWRLMRAGYINEIDNNPKKSGWFNSEQLSSNEMNDCMEMLDEFNSNCGNFDFIFTHTCPIRWQPTDLFLDSIDQSKVDKSMEKFLDEVVDKVDWFVWCFGHYHRDRLERPYVEQYFNNIEELNSIYDRWNNYLKTKELPWYIPKSPNFDK